MRDRGLRLPAVHASVRSTSRTCTSPGPIDDPRIVAIGSVVIGIVLAVIILSLTGRYTGTEHRPVQDVAKTSLTGAATVVSVRASPLGFESSVYTAVVIAAAVLGAYLLGGAGDHLAVRHRAGRLWPADHGRRDRRHGHLRPGLRQRPGHRRDVRRRARRGREDPDRARRGRQHDQGDHQGHRDRHRRIGGDRAVRLLHRRDRRGARSPATTQFELAGGVVFAPPTLVGIILGAVGGVPVLRAGDQRRRPGGRRGGLRGTSAVPRDPRDHGGHRQAGVRQGRRHLHPRLTARAGHARPAGPDGPDRGRVRARCPGAGRLSGRRHRLPAP